jgi:hypothetical protein
MTAEIGSRSNLSNGGIGCRDDPAARRHHFDNLVWQVPVISLTGQAFRFTIAPLPNR